MNYKTKIFTRSSVNALFITGVLGFLIHPFVLFGYHFPDLGFMAWVYLVPLLIGIHHYDLKGKFVLIFLSAMLSHFGVFYWFITAMQRFGDLNFFEAFGVMIVFSAVLSFIQTMFIGTMSWVNHRIKIPLFILLPLFMTTHNFILHHFPFYGFPWAIPAYSQGAWIKFFQWIDFTGILGLSFMIYLINGLLADGLLLLIHRKQLDKLVSRVLVIFVVAMLSLYISFISNRYYEKDKVRVGSASIALIQGNIPQDVKWDPFKAQDNLDIYLKLSAAAVKDGAQLVVWPETAYPYGLMYDKLQEDRFLDKEELSVPFLFGGVVLRKEDHQTKIFNSVIFVDKQAKFGDVYHKLHLVPFGEYMPFEKFTKFMSGMIKAVGEFSPGSEYLMFNIDGIKFAPLICFEDIFPDYARRFSQMSADVLLNFTNDAWYGNTSAQHQHLVSSKFRALENRRYLLRSTNTGMTTIINPRGQVIDYLEPFTEDFLLYNLTIDKADSFYTRHGDTWVYVLMTLTGIILVYTLIKHRTGPVKIEF